MVTWAQNKQKLQYGFSKIQSHVSHPCPTLLRFPALKYSSSSCTIARMVCARYTTHCMIGNTGSLRRPSQPVRSQKRALIFSTPHTHIYIYNMYIYIYTYVYACVRMYNVYPCVYIYIDIFAEICIDHMYVYNKHIDIHTHISNIYI